MTKQEKNEVIGVLKEKFGQYNNFYITNTESLSVEQISNLRRFCFDKKVEMKVAKNTLIRKALESLDAEKYAGVYDSLNNVTALMFSENPKEPALIISSFRKQGNVERPELISSLHQRRYLCWRQQLDSIDTDQNEERTHWRSHRIVAVSCEARFGRFVAPPRETRCCSC